VTDEVRPQASRPEMPEGYGVPESEEGMLDWSWAAGRLESALTYWFGTTRPDGRPHAMPGWAVWLDGLLYFEGSPLTRRARNVAVNPAVVVHLESGDEVVIVEGEATEVGTPERTLAERLSAAFTAKYASTKYEYRPTPEQWDRGGLWALEPRRAFGWTDFPADTTRWQFAG